MKISMKRVLALLLCGILVFALIGCGGKADSSKEQTNDKEAGTEAESVKDTDASESAEDSDHDSDMKKVAVVYFSATGTTKEIAQMIVKETDADLYEIQPADTYTKEDLNYDDDSCRANQEMNDDSARPEIKNDLSQVTRYETIYLGHSIWWGAAPRIIQTFIETYDLSGAEIHTFCTSGSTGIDQSINDLKNNYPKLNIVDGKRLNDATEDDIKDWVSE